MIVVTESHPQSGCKMFEDGGNFVALDSMREAVGFDYSRRHETEKGKAVNRLDFVPLNDEQREEAIRIGATEITNEEGDAIETSFPRPELVG